MIQYNNVNRFVLQEMGKIVECCLTCEELVGVTWNSSDSVKNLMGVTWSVSDSVKN